MKRLLGSRRVTLLAILLVLLGTTVALVAPARAAGVIICGQFFTYYTDATRTTEVGERGSYCDCTTVHWGPQTPYFRVWMLDCSDS
jgi:hypothetical protein